MIAALSILILSKCWGTYSARGTFFTLSNSKVPDATQESGVTALATLGSYGVATGNKLGKLEIQEIQRSSGNPTPTSAQFCRSINGASNRPSPIFCLAFAESEDLLFSGAGDRYVSVWEKEGKNWICSDTLGPHTGWVRDLLYDRKSGRLHSIGCNCIETWTLSEAGVWEHWEKSKIESSPLDGATLSSDLLCLSAFQEPYFLAGGVDGRLHVWNSAKIGSPIRSHSAHNGRVNDITYSSSGFIFSAGNDGKVLCWQSVSENFDFKLVTSFEVENSRITCLWASDKVGDLNEFIFCGTNHGEVVLLALADGGGKLSPISTFQLIQQPIIHCFCVDEQDKDFNLWIGHSNGLSVYPLSSFVGVKGNESS